MTTMTEGLIAVPAEEVPRGRGTNPFIESVDDIAKQLSEHPGTWWLIGKGSKDDRSRLNNAAALLSGSKYKTLSEYYERGRFETRVSGAKDAWHADQYEVGVFARFVPNDAETENDE